MKGVHPWLDRCACCAGTRDFCSAPFGCSSWNNIFFPHRTLSCWVTCLLACVSGCSLAQAGGGEGVAEVDPNHTSVKARGVLPNICFMTRNNKSCLVCVSLKLIPPAAALSFLQRRNSRLAIYVTRISHKFLFSHIN
jgi:hypothetical protein